MAGRPRLRRWRPRQPDTSHVTAHRLNGPLLRIDNPIECNASLGILLELIPAVDRHAGGAEHLDAKIRRAFHRLLANQMRAGLRVIEQVGTTDVVLAKDRVDIRVEATELPLFNVLAQNRSQLNNRVTMRRNWTRAHRHLPIDEFQPHPRRIFAQFEELPRRHFGRADDRHFTSQASIPQGISDHFLFCRPQSKLSGMIRSALSVASVLLVTSAVVAQTAHRASAPAATQRARYEVNVPPGFQKLTIGDHSVLVEPADITWVQEAGRL